MAKQVKLKEVIRALAKPKRTSIGQGHHSRPNRKHWRKRWKRNVGQG